MDSLASQRNPGVCWVTQGPSCSASQGFCQRQGEFDKEMWLKKLEVRRQCAERNLEGGRVAVPSRHLARGGGLENASPGSMLRGN